MKPGEFGTCELDRSLCQKATQLTTNSESASFYLVVWVGVVKEGPPIYPQMPGFGSNPNQTKGYLSEKKPAKPKHGLAKRPRELGVKQIEARSGNKPNKEAQNAWLSFCFPFKTTAKKNKPQRNTPRLSGAGEIEEGLPTRCWKQHIKANRKCLVH